MAALVAPTFASPRPSAPATSAHPQTPLWKDAKIKAQYLSAQTRLHNERRNRIRAKRLFLQAGSHLCETQGPLTKELSRMCLEAKRELKRLRDEQSRESSERLRIRQQAAEDHTRERQELEATNRQRLELLVDDLEMQNLNLATIHPPPPPRSRSKSEPLFSMHLPSKPLERTLRRCSEADRRAPTNEALRRVCHLDL